MTATEKRKLLLLLERVVMADLLSPEHVAIILAVCENAIDRGEAARREGGLRGSSGTHGGPNDQKTKAEGAGVHGVFRL